MSDFIDVPIGEVLFISFYFYFPARHPVGRIHELFPLDSHYQLKYDPSFPVMPDDVGCEAAVAELRVRCQLKVLRISYQKKKKTAPRFLRAKETIGLGVTTAYEHGLSKGAGEDILHRITDLTEPKTLDAVMTRDGARVCRGCHWLTDYFCYLLILEPCDRVAFLRSGLMIALHVL